MAEVAPLIGLATRRSSTHPDIGLERYCGMGTPCGRGRPVCTGPRRSVDSAAQTLGWLASSLVELRTLRAIAGAPASVATLMAAARARVAVSW